MRIVFMGTPQFALPSLQALLDSPDDVVGVVTQPDRPKGRGRVLTPPPVKLVCELEHLPYLQPLKMKDAAFVDALRAWQPDLIAVAAFGRILPPFILDLPPRGCVNVHGSLLPKYRGAGPVQWAIINGERETGVTTMLMDAGMDTGQILLQERIPIGAEETAGELSQRLAELGGRLLVETIRRLKEGTLVPQKQDDSKATMAPLMKKEDGLIDWRQSAVTIANRVRGMSPWPGAFTYAGPERWTVWRGVPTGESPAGNAPGTIQGVSAQGIYVATGDGVLAIVELQPADRRRMTAAEYLAGHPVPPGFALGTGPPSGSKD